MARGVSHEIMMGKLAKMTACDQLRQFWNPVISANLAALPWCFKNEKKQIQMSLKLWTNPAYFEGFLTLSDLVESEAFDSISAKSLTIGHPDFIGFDLIRNSRSELKMNQKAILPFYVVNYLQDEERHELHILGIVIFAEIEFAEIRKDSILIVDPNGVCPEDFGEPNAVMFRLPWMRN